MNDENPSSCVSPIGGDDEELRLSSLQVGGSSHTDGFGERVSISHNGSVVAVGARFARSGGEAPQRLLDAGAVVTVMVVSEDDDDDDTLLSFRPRRPVLEGANSYDWMSANALSGDGKILAVGAPGSDDNGLLSGQVNVYRYDDEQDYWLPIGLTLVGSTERDEFGFSVALSGAGTVLAVGAPSRFSSSQGQVLIFRWNGTIWDDKEDLPITGKNSQDEFGYSLSISNDGNVLAVGAPENDENGEFSGSVQVFAYMNNTNAWDQMGQHLVGEKAWDYSGWSVSLATGGNQVAVAIGTRFGDQVQVYGFEDGQQKWSQMGNSLMGDFSSDRFGDSVSLSGDSSILAVGAPGYNITESNRNNGLVRLFAWDGLDWQQFGSDIVGSRDDHGLGDAVAMSSDGTTLVVGGYAHGFGRPGSAQVFRLNETCPMMAPSSALVVQQSPTPALRTLEPTATPSQVQQLATTSEDEENSVVGIVVGVVAGGLFLAALFVGYFVRTRRQISKSTRTHETHETPDPSGVAPQEPGVYESDNAGTGMGSDREPSNVLLVTEGVARLVSGGENQIVSPQQQQQQQQSSNRPAGPQFKDQAQSVAAVPHQGERMADAQVLDDGQHADPLDLHAAAARDVQFKDQVRDVAPPQPLPKADAINH